MSAEIGIDMSFKKITPRKDKGFHGTWVEGKLNGHEFSALVFSEHAEYEDFELGKSKISKLRIVRIKDGKVVFNFDRGMEFKPKTKLAEDIADFLAAGLSEMVYSE